MGALVDVGLTVVGLPVVSWPVTAGESLRLCLEAVTMFILVSAVTEIL